MIRTGILCGSDSRFARRRGRNRTIWRFSGRRMRMKSIGSFLLVFGALSCATGGSKKPVRRVMSGDLVIQLMPDTAWLDTRRHYFQMPLNVYNLSNVPVMLDVCGIKAEKLVNGEWQKVFLPNCMGGRFSIEPGRGTTDLLEVYGGPGFGWTLGTDVRVMAGTYRAVGYFGVYGQPVEVVRSRTFTVAIVDSANFRNGPVKSQ
jgi:hypothetical protein